MSEPEAQNKIEAAGDLGLEDVALYKVDARLAHSRPFTYGSDDGRKVDHRHVEAAARRLDRVLAMPPGDIEDRPCARERFETHVDDGRGPVARSYPERSQPFSDIPG